MGFLGIRLLSLAALVARAAAFDFDDEAPAAAVPAKPKPAPETSKTVSLLHRIGDAGAFAERSKLWYREAASAGGGLRVRLGPAKLSGAERDAFAALLDSGGHYTLRLPSNFSAPADSPPVFASVSACSLAESRFEEAIELTFSTAGTLTSVSYTVPAASECPPTLPLAATEARPPHRTRAAAAPRRRAGLLPGR